MNPFLLAGIAAIAGIIGAAIAAAGVIYQSRRQRSGTVETSEAGELWTTLRGMLETSLAQLAVASDESTGLRAELVTVRGEAVGLRSDLTTVRTESVATRIEMTAAREESAALRIEVAGLRQQLAREATGRAELVERVEIIGEQIAGEANKQ